MVIKSQIKPGSNDAAAMRSNIFSISTIKKHNARNTGKIGAQRKFDPRDCAC